MQTHCVSLLPGFENRSKPAARKDKTAKHLAGKAREVYEVAFHGIHFLKHRTGN
jgi:hypothetical protein